MSSKNKIFVRNLPYLVTRFKLKKHFENFGQIISAEVGYNWKTGLSNKFGIVEFKNHEDFKKALAKETHTLLGEKVVVVESKNFTIEIEPKEN